MWDNVNEDGMRLTSQKVIQPNAFTAKQTVEYPLWLQIHCYIEWIFLCTYELGIAVDDRLPLIVT